MVVGEDLYLDVICCWDLLRKQQRKDTIENGDGNTLRSGCRSGLRRGFAMELRRRLEVTDRTDHALHIVGFEVDGAVEEQKDALRITALTGDGGIIGC